MKLDSKLVEATKTFIQSRFPTEGWAGAAGMYTEDGDILISTAPEVVGPFSTHRLQFIPET